MNSNILLPLNALLEKLFTVWHWIIVFTTQGHNSSHFMWETNLVTSDMAMFDLKKQSYTHKKQQNDEAFDVASMSL